jgi:hypothetical protein
VSGILPARVFTTKAAPMSSIDQGGGKRRDRSAASLFIAAIHARRGTVDDLGRDNGQSEGANDLLDNRFHGLKSSSFLNVAPPGRCGL